MWLGSRHSCELKVSMQRSMEYISAPPLVSDVLSASDQSIDFCMIFQRKRVGAPPGAMGDDFQFNHIKENDHPSSKVCFFPPCFKGTIGLLC